VTFTGGFSRRRAGGADDDFRAAAEPVTFQGNRLRILSPTDQLLHVCGHAARWGEVPAIRWVADAVLILREGPIDWQRFLVTPRSGGSFSGCGRCSATCGRRWCRPFLPRSRRSWLDSRCRCSSASSIESGTENIGCSGSCRPTCSIAGAASRTRCSRSPVTSVMRGGLESRAEVPRHALTLAVRRAKPRYPPAR
jgi:hypothetical protein